MKINRAYKVELDPNNEQRTALLRHCGAARFVYNWGLNRKIEALNAKQKLPTARELAKELRSVRAEVAPWLTECASILIDGTLPYCDFAFEEFFRRCKVGGPGKKGFPKFRSRKNGIGSTRWHKDYRVRADCIQLPRIGWVRLKELGYIPLSGTEGINFHSATVSEKAGRWFVSVQVELYARDEAPVENAPVIGVDFGIKTLAVCSDGRTFENPRALRKNLRKIKRLQKAMSRKANAARTEGRLVGSNYLKNKKRLAQLHARIANVRKNALHNLSHRLTKNKCILVIEDLNVAGMVKNHRLSQAISDCGFAELRRQLTYKCEWRGGEVVVADRWFASSKTCHICGVVNKALMLQTRHWTCECGAKHERDLNAARNLAAFYCGAKDENKDVAGTASETQNARREGRSEINALALPSLPLIEAGTSQLLLFETT